MFNQKKMKREPNTEVDLVAFISLLSVCICFLLLSTVWLRVGVIDVKQAIGGQASSESKNTKVEMWVLIGKNGTLKVEMKNQKNKANKLNHRIVGSEGRPNLKELKVYLEGLRNNKSEVSIALMRPSKVTLFEDIINVMDVFRENEIMNLGILPL